jgi:flagellar protein FliO/FliZ
MRRFLLGVSFIVSVLLSTPNLGHADTIQPIQIAATDNSAVIYPRALAPAQQINPQSSYGGVGFGLLFAMCGAALGIFLWMRSKNGLQLSARTEQKLKVNEMRSLGNRQYLVVATYGEQKFLLGVCPGKVELISPLERNFGEGDL